MDSFRVGRNSTCKRGANFQPAKILNFQLAVERVVDRFVQSEEINPKVDLTDSFSIQTQPLLSTYEDSGRANATCDLGCCQERSGVSFPTRAHGGFAKVPAFKRMNCRCVFSTAEILLTVKVEYRRITYNQAADLNRSSQIKTEIFLSPV